MKATIIAVLLAGSALAAKDHAAKNATSTKAQCHEVAKLTALNELAANQTKLDKVTKGNATKIADIQAAASSGAATLQTLQANTTLMTACDQIFAVQKTQSQCGQMMELQRLDKIVANQTELDKVTKGNATKAAALQAKASSEATKLDALQSNTTLTQFCSVEQTKAECGAMKKLSKQVAEANNQTFLDAHFKGNETKIAKFKNETVKAQTKLTAMQSNTTFTDACNALKKDATENQGTNSATKGNAAGSFRPDGTMVSLAALFAVALYAL